MFTIITQDIQAVNYNAVRTISIIRTVVEAIETGEEIEMIAIVASLLEEEKENLLVLGYYPTEEKAIEIFQSLMKCLENAIDRTFTMPEPEQGELS